jgi:nitrate reductase cytochrome c-type subunit
MMRSRVASHKMRMAMIQLVWIAALGAALMACRATDTGTPTNTPRPSPPATAEPQATMTELPTFTPEPTATSKPTSTPVPTATEEPRPTMTASPTSTPEPTATPVPQVPAAQRYVHDNLATGDVGLNEYASSAPGHTELLERGYPGAPPFIPHSIVGFGITKDANDCLICHEEGRTFSGHVATQIPDSHFIDLVTGTRGETLQGTRYYCLLCHVPQSAEPPLR